MSGWRYTMLIYFFYEKNVCFQCFYRENIFIIGPLQYIQWINMFVSCVVSKNPMNTQIHNNVIRSCHLTTRVGRAQAQLRYPCDQIRSIVILCLL